MSKAILFARSLAFNIGFYGWTLLVMLVMLPTLLMPGWKPSAHAGPLWIHGMQLLLRVCCGIRAEIRGRQFLPDGPMIIASKHQSAWETGIFHVLLPFPVYVLKKELLSLPLFGAFLRKSGMIAIDRSAKTQALNQLVHDAKKVLDAGRPIILFPEGTRVAAGEKGKYRSGIAALYTHLSAPVVPVALNSGVCWGKNSFLKTPGTIVLEFLPPLAPGLKREEFMRELEEKIEAATNRLVAEARN